ncbi:hypothetical protein E3E35_08055 [Thermococcus sp. GR7]|uniref:hypothetical protein n=1 Tax=unclassified Thermococcus TaxID=2627626 RepID=UPI0014307EE3|nr:MULTISPECIES: hypothetical protein [unclassified Thermococcus]NJE47351.1 hypothetical protein [Thermococcus sp. GR7]NJE78846.1 hypothetical protein [Thermococcus sp. GR4]NJF23159.1 hypothetical protein [Thermococcus sp. GR5]
MRRYLYYVIESEVEFLKPGQVFLSEKPAAEDWWGRPLLRKGAVGHMALYDEKDREFKHVEVKYLGYADFKDYADLQARGPKIIEKKLAELGIKEAGA